jgi:hypothetical protein
VCAAAMDLSACLNYRPLPGDPTAAQAVHATQRRSLHGA